MEAQTATGFDFETEFYIWGFSIFGPNEFASFVAEGYSFDLLLGPSWDWKPRTGETIFIDPSGNRAEVPEWWRLPYLVKQYGDEVLGEHTHD